jgi:hypothetical protein
MGFKKFDPWVLENLFGTTISTLGQRLIGKIAARHFVSGSLQAVCMHVNSYGDLCPGVRGLHYDDFAKLLSQ